MSAAIVAGTAVLLPPLHCPAQSPAVAAAPGNGAEIEQQIAALGSNNSSSEQREEAARRLVSRPSPRTVEAVGGALRNSDSPAVQLAVTRAIASAGAPAAEWVDPLFTILKNSTSEVLTRASADALTAYRARADVLSRLVDLANRRTDDPTGVASISAIGKFTEKSAADALVSLINRDGLSPRARGAVIDALASLTGITAYGRDVQQWDVWWQQNGGKSEADFRADLLLSRSRRYDETARELATLDRSTETLIRDQYRLSGREARPDLLAAYLQNPSAAVRRVGASLASQDASEGRPLRDDAIGLLRDLVGDSDERVRNESVNALARVNDPRAFEALTGQLDQESNADVRAAIARALANLADVRAADKLIALLDDRSPIVVKAAADALNSIGKQLQENQPDKATVAAAKLKQIIDSSAGKANLQEVRESALEALVPLHRPEMLDQFVKLLRREESTRIRRAAVRGIAGVGRKEDADAIAPFLDDSDKAVQLDSIKAIGQLGASEFAPKLVSRINGGTSDESIKQAAWESLQSFVNDLKPNQLQRHADELRAQPSKRAFLLKELAEKQIQDKQMADWAITQQNIGQCEMELGDFDAAATAYQQALNQVSSDAKAPEGTVATLLRSRMNAILRGGRFSDAKQFASEWIRKDPDNQLTFGPLIRTEVERLLAEAEEKKNNEPLTRALGLIAEARKIDPSLTRQYQEQLTSLESDINKRIAGRSQAPNPSGGATAKTDLTRE